jgi:hypothetical protein
MTPVPNPAAKGILPKCQSQVAREGEETKKHLEACLERRRHFFTPFVCSVDGMLGREAKTFVKRPAAKHANKWESPVQKCMGTSTLN